MVVAATSSAGINENMKSEKIGDYAYTLKEGINLTDDIKYNLEQFRKYD